MSLLKLSLEFLHLEGQETQQRKSIPHPGCAVCLFMFGHFPKLLTCPCSFLQWQKCAGRRAPEADWGFDWEFPGACQEWADLALCIEPREHRVEQRTQEQNQSHLCVCVFETAAFFFCKEEAFFCQAFHQTGTRRGGQRKGCRICYCSFQSFWPKV